MFSWEKKKKKKKKKKKTWYSKKSKSFPALSGDIFSSPTFLATLEPFKSY